MPSHEDYMQRALQLARKGLGHTSPNPLVGAVIVKNDEIIAEGFHQAYGKPHAEVEAINAASRSLQGATLYVTLEPCTFFGKTPPCVDRIIASGIGQVVIASRDPNPKVNGKGIETLRNAGVEVIEGVLEKEARELNRGFFSYITRGTPYLSLKLAATLDGFLADQQGGSQWISSQPAREWVHQKRTEYDAIMVGFGTAFKDNPRLTTRGRRKPEPYRIVVDESLSLPFHLKLLSDEYRQRTVLITTEEARERKGEKYRQAGIKVLPVAEEEGGWVDLKKALTALSQEMGITSVLVEGGSMLAGSLLRMNLIDDLYLVLAPRAVGNGIPLFSGVATTIKQPFNFQWVQVKPLGTDYLLYAKPMGE